MIVSLRIQLHDINACKHHEIALVKIKINIVQIKLIPEFCSQVNEIALAEKCFFQDND